VRKDHEQVVLQSTQMINIPPRSYCVVANPYVRKPNGEPVTLEDGQVKLVHGETEVRIFNEWPVPFPLYPGESLKEPVTLLRVVSPNTALRISALRDFADGETKRAAGDEWLFVGPGTYIPRVECVVVETIVAQVIKPQQAMKMKAVRHLVDHSGVERSAGEEWLVKDQGSFLPGVYEQVVGMVKARVLTEKRALHLRASHTFQDAYGVLRKAGQEWLVTHKNTQAHICDVHEIVVGDVAITTLSKQQYCIVLNPVDRNMVPQWGKRELRRGECNFFLEPGEKLESGVQTVEILGEEEALLLRANETFVEEVDEKKVNRKPGEEWMIYGPRKYVPPAEVRILERRRKIPLDENEGIYIRDKSTGKVYTVTGQTYMLKPNEELWDKVLSPIVEELLQVSGYRGQNAGGASSNTKANAARVAYKVVTYRVPHNAAVQLYDYKKKKSRVVFGPELVMLEPDEEFSIMSLSGGEPKRANAITSLSLLLGPDFMNDTVVVETSDHARLKLKLSYNWVFEVDKTDEKQAHTVFSVRDFVGDTCKAIASRVRGAVAAQTFDYFHKHSADIIKHAVFGKKDDGEAGERLLFSANLLSVTNVDIQSVEPVEQRTRDALQKSVQLAIEIATASQEALANHEAQREEQVAEGRMQRQKIEDQAAAERQRKSLVELKAKSAAVESTGQAKAEAIARSEAALIKGKAAVKQAELKAQAAKIRYEAKLAQLALKNAQELEYRSRVDELEISKAEKEAKIEAEKFASIVSAIGADTIEAIARAGPEMQAKLLEGLGLQGFLVTDGTSPINLFNTANGLVGSSGM
jgi:major vault protein